MVFGLLSLLGFVLVVSVIGAFVRRDGHLHWRERAGRAEASPHT